MRNQAALYLRSSKDRKDVSPDAQRRALLELAEARGLAVVEEFVDAVESGKDENRPGFQRLVKAVRDPDRGWQTVLMYDTSRLSRRRVISLIFEEVDCKQNGVSVVYKTLPDVDELTEMLLKSILVAWDEYHSILSKQKGLAGMTENVRAGFRAGGRAPYGYRLRKVPTGAIRDGEAVTKSVLEVDPDRAPAIGRYLRERASGVPRRRAIELAGVDDVRDTSLISIEWNALTYAGHTVWNVHAEREGGGYVGGAKRRPRSEWVVQRDTHEALITDEQAEALLGHLEGRAGKRLAEPRFRKSVALLGGILFAPDGVKWWSERDRYRYPGERKVSVPTAAIENPVIDQVLEDLASAEFAERLVESTRRALAKDVDLAELTRVRREIAELAKRISRTMDLATEVEDPAPVLRKVDELEALRREKLEQIRELEHRAERAQRIAQVRVADVRRVLADIGEAAKKDAHSEELRASIVSLVERVVLDPASLAATLHYRVAAPASGNKVASPRQAVATPHVHLTLAVPLRVRVARRSRAA